MKKFPNSTKLFGICQYKYNIRDSFSKYTKMICTPFGCFPVSGLLPLLLLLISPVWRFIKKVLKLEKERTEEDILKETQEDHGNNFEAVVTPIVSSDDWHAKLSEAESYGVPLIAYFTAPWCKKCVEIVPVFEELCATHRALCVKVDIQQHEELESSEGIQMLPTFKAYRHSKCIDQTVGIFPNQLRTLFHDHSKLRSQPKVIEYYPILNYICDRHP